MKLMNDRQHNKPHTRSSRHKSRPIFKLEGHVYTVDSRLGVWHWQTTSENGAIGWLRIGEACDVEDAEMFIAEHATSTPVDEEASRWAVLPLQDAFA